MSKKLERPDDDRSEKWKSDVKEIFSDAMNKNPDAFKVEKDTEYKPLNVAIHFW